MPNIDLSVSPGQTKQLTFECANTYTPENIVFNITASGGDANTDYVIQCETAANQRLKQGTSVTSYTPTKGIHLIHIKNANSNTSNGLYGQFNGVPSSTTTLIYINGAQSSSSNRTLPAGLYAAYYDGTAWHFRTDGRIDFGGSGFLKADGSIDTNTYTSNTGTVTSVGLSNATNGGLTISGSPVTGSGSITVGHSNVLQATGTNVGNNTTTSLSHGGTFSVPYFSYDINGHITSASTKTLTLPASGNTDNFGTVYVETAAGTRAKTATVPWTYTLKTGNVFVLYLKTTNTVTTSGSSYVTLNINNTGAKQVRINGAVPTTSNWTAGTYLCYYDGTYYQMYTNRDPFRDTLPPDAGTTASAVGTSSSGGSATTYSKSDHVHNITSSTITTALGYTPVSTDTNTTTSGFAYCSSDGHTKTATIPNFELVTNQWFLIHFEVGHTLSQTVTLNINNTGAKTVSSVNGVALNTTNFSIFSNGLYYCKYNGTSYELKFAQSRPYYSYVVGNSSSLVTTGGVTNGNVYLNLVEHSVGVGIAGGDSSVHIEGLNGITVYTDDSGVLCVDGAGCSGGGGNDRNYYPTAMSWTNGTSSGPTATITMSGTNNISVGAIPSANGTTNSGIVTTGAQDFGGVKTFLSEPKIKVGTIKVANNNNTYYTQTFPKQNGTVTNGTGTSGYLAKWTGANTIGNGPQLGSSTTTFLRNDGTWAVPAGGGGGGGSTVSAVGSENQTNGYKVGSITIDGGITEFVVSPARAVQSGGSSSGAFSFQGVVRPISEVTMGDTEFSEIDGGTTIDAGDILYNCDVAGAPDYNNGGLFIPITMLYHYNYETYRWESVPYLFIPNDLIRTFSQVYTNTFSFPE